MRVSVFLDIRRFFSAPMIYFNALLGSNVAYNVAFTASISL